MESQPLGPPPAPRPRRAVLSSVRSAQRWFTGAVPLAILSVLLLASLLMMSEATQNSAVFGRLYSWLLVLNIIGVILLSALIFYNLRRLFRQYRRGVPGSRLTPRLESVSTLSSDEVRAIIAPNDRKGAMHACALSHKTGNRVGRRPRRSPARRTFQEGRRGS